MKSAEAVAIQEGESRLQWECNRYPRYSTANNNRYGSVFSTTASCSLSSPTSGVMSSPDSIPSTSISTSSAEEIPGLLPFLTGKMSTPKTTQSSQTSLTERSWSHSLSPSTISNANGGPTETMLPMTSGFVTSSSVSITSMSKSCDSFLTPCDCIPMTSLPNMRSICPDNGCSSMTSPSKSIYSSLKSCPSCTSNFVASHSESFPTFSTSLDGINNNLSKAVLSKPEVIDPSLKINSLMITTNTRFPLSMIDSPSQVKMHNGFSVNSKLEQVPYSNENDKLGDKSEVKHQAIETTESQFLSMNQSQQIQLLLRLVDNLEEEARATLMDHLASFTPVSHFASIRIASKLHSTCPRSHCGDFTVIVPREISLHIFSFLDPVSLVRCSAVNSSWQYLAKDPSLYRRFCGLPKWTVCHQVARQQAAAHTDTKDGFVQWFAVFKERYQMRRNWLLGRCKSRVFTGHTSSVSCVAFDDHRIVSGSADSTIRVWDIRTNAAWSVQTLIGHSDTVRCLQLLDEEDTLDDPPGSPRQGEAEGRGVGGSRLISGSNDRTIKVWDLSNSDLWSSITCRMTLTGHTDAVRCLQADKDKIVSGSYDHTLRLWCVKTGEHKRTFVGHEGHVLCLQFDDTKLVSGSQDKTIKIWNLQTGYCLRTLVDHEASVACLRFDQRSIVSGSHDHSLKLWDLNESGGSGCRRTIDWKAGEGHSRVVRCLQADRWRILSGADDRTIKVWSAETGDRLCTFQCHTDGVTCLQFNDRMIVSGSYDKSVILWDFSV